MSIFLNVLICVLVVAGSLSLLFTVMAMFCEVEGKKPGDGFIFALYTIVWFAGAVFIMGLL